MKTMLTTLALLAATLFAAPAHAATEVGSLYAFSVQPQQTPTGVGYVQINYVAGVTWYMDGQEVTVTSPSTKFYFPSGFQSDVYAVPNPGYQITSDVQGTQDRPFWLTVNAAPVKKAAVKVWTGRAGHVNVAGDNVSLSKQRVSRSTVLVTVKADFGYTVEDSALTLRTSRVVHLHR